MGWTDLKNPPESSERSDDAVNSTIVIGHVSVCRMDLTMLKVLEAGLVRGINHARTPAGDAA